MQHTIAPDLATAKAARMTRDDRALCHTTVAFVVPAGLPRTLSPNRSGGAAVPTEGATPLSSDFANLSWPILSVLTNFTAAMMNQEEAEA